MFDGFSLTSLLLIYAVLDLRKVGILGISFQNHKTTIFTTRLISELLGCVKLSGYFDRSSAKDLETPKVFHNPKWIYFTKEMAGKIRKSTPPCKHGLQVLCWSALASAPSCNLSCG